AFGVPLLLNAEAKARLMRNYARPEDLNEMRLRMARIPEGAELIDNPISHAPGFRLGNVFVLAGVPRIMQAMFGALQTGLRRGRPMLSRTVTVRVPEGLIAAALAATQDRYPAVEIGSYPGGSGPGHFQVSVVLRGKEAILVNRAAEEVRDLAGRLTETPIEDDGPLPCP
ncbi:MAG: competence/damage-inducible protein A, partial [Rhodospirillales bacterium]|nr:competence/damage-inducible protein A [Rhodospirillales bacterium]